MSYEIGYRRPPKQTQFSKGASGNPAGRPKGSRNFATLLAQELNQKVVITENGRKRSMTRLQALAKKIVNSGLVGDGKALKLLLDAMRAAGHINPNEAESLLPDNHEEILREFLAKHSRGGR